MKPTQNNNENKKRAGDMKWQEPDPGSTQKFITPGAEKSMREGAGRYRVVRSDTTPRPKVKRPVQSQRAAPENRKGKSFFAALKDEIRERLSAIGFSITVNSEDIIKASVIAGYMIFFALMQTTFFARFTPFGAVPDLMLAFTAAVAQSEGEKWGGVCGLIAAFVIQALGGVSGLPHVLPLLYMPVGYAVGILSGYYFSSTVPVKLMYIVGCGVLRILFTSVVAAVNLGTSASQLFLDVLVPEFFSTVLLAPAVYFLVFLGTKPFHKTRAERTDSGADRA